MENVFYDFVRDGQHNHKITENKIIRFYESINKYWIFQIIEIFLILALVITLIFLLINPSNIKYLTLLAILIAGIINRFIDKNILKEVKEKTMEEIRDIHHLYNKELEDKIAKFHKDNGLTYYHGRT